MKNIEDAKKAILTLLDKKGITFTDEEWSADYKVGWNEEFTKLMNSALDDIEKMSIAIEGNNDISGVAAITMARIKLLHLSDFFLNIHEDLEKLLLTNDIKWPKIPTDYKY